ncbi:Uncharacterised protein [Bordetella pertussis]|nr:Uncharacterised protein [Bordetella pertussis]
MRRAEHHNVRMREVRIIGLKDALQRVCFHIQDPDITLGAKRGRQVRRFRRHAHDVKHRNRAKTGQRRAQMLECIAVGANVKPGKNGNIPIAVHGLANQAAQRSPFRQLTRRGMHAYDHVRLARLVQMKTIAGHASGHGRGQGRRPGLKVRARTVNRIGVNDRACVTPPQVLAQAGLHVGLVDDAVVALLEAHFAEGGDRARLDLDGAGVLP